MNKTIVACLDITDGMVSKGIRFEKVEKLLDPIERGLYYQDQGIDELVYYDIRASLEKRGTFLDQVKELSKKLTIPFTVGGGIRTIEDVEEVLDAGADKVSINSAAIEDISIIKEASDRFGSGRVMGAMDIKRIGDHWEVFKAGGMKETGIDAIEWAKNLEKEGAGELCINSIDNDGIKKGFDLDLMNALKEAVQIPLIASGGAGTLQDFKDAFDAGIEKALGASVFHYDIIDIPSLKTYLSLDFSQLIPTIVQDIRTREVLMLAHSNQESFEKMLETKKTWFYSRSRQTLWNKGETSGNYQMVESVSFDCDFDTILVQVKPVGPSCHTGAVSCFYNTILSTDIDNGILFKEYDVIADRKRDPGNGYTDYLFNEGLDKILKKVGEETTETIIASKNENQKELIHEVSDLYYHLNVLLVEKGVILDEVMKEIASRRKATRK